MLQQPGFLVMAHLERAGIPFMNMVNQADTKSALLYRPILPAEVIIVIPLLFHQRYRVTFMQVIRGLLIQIIQEK